MPPQIRSYAAAPCPACQARMAIRRCPTAHRLKRICEACSFCLPLAIDIKLRLAGYPQLPGFELIEEPMTTTDATKIVIVAGQEFSVPASTDNEAIRSHLASQGFADVASATIQKGKRTVGEQTIETVEFVKKAGTKGMNGAELAALIGRAPAAPPPKARVVGPTREQAQLLYNLRDGVLTIGQALTRLDDLDGAITSYYRTSPTNDFHGSRLCERLSLHPTPADTDVHGW